MYHKICYILVLLGQIQNLKTAYIEKDSATNPFVYHQEREIEIEISETEFSYQFDLSIIKELKSEYKKFKNICQNPRDYGDLYLMLFTRNMMWNHNVFENPPEKNLIYMEPYNIKALKFNLLDIKRGNYTKNKCNSLIASTEQLRMLNGEFKNFEKLIFTTISNMIPVEKLLTHANMYTSKTNLTSALDFTHWFTYNFYKYSKMEYLMTNNYAYLTIKIPLYTHAILSKIYPKPIFHNNIPYISNSQTEYLIENQTGINSQIWKKMFLCK